MMKQIAKPIDNVSNSELISFPVWEFALDQEETLDETAIRPVQELPVSIGGLLFCTQIKLSCGQIYWALLGNLDPRDADSTARYLTVSILKEEKRFHLARAIDFDYEARGPRALGDFLGLKSEDIFPIAYDIRSVCHGEPRSLAGEIHL